MLSNAQFISKVYKKKDYLKRKIRVYMMDVV